MTLSELQSKVWHLMDAKGFHDGRAATRDDTLVRLCLIHTEVSEAAQEVKRHWTDEPSTELRAKVGEELADILIRLCDLAECIDVDLEDAAARKMAKNALRPMNYGTPRQIPAKVD